MNQPIKTYDIKLEFESEDDRNQVIEILDKWDKKGIEKWNGPQSDISMKLSTTEKFTAK